MNHLSCRVTGQYEDKDNCINSLLTVSEEQDTYGLKSHIFFLLTMALLTEGELKLSLQNIKDAIKKMLSSTRYHFYGTFQVNIWVKPEGLNKTPTPVS